MTQINPGKNFHFKEFSNLDNSPDADYLITSMDVMSSLDSIKSIKKRAIETMNLQKGDFVLEIGCGHGEDAEAIGQIVGDTGSVLAVDLSQRMIDEAKRRSKQTNVRYLAANVNQLNYPDRPFTACHADRLLVGHENYQDFFKTITKLIQPKGIVCFTDVDALSIIISPYNRTTEMILAQTQQSFVNPHIGRDLAALFIQQGLKNVTIIPETSLIRSFETLKKIFDFPKIAQEAIKSGKITYKEALHWEDELYQADKKGEFLYCITFFTVLGHIPS